MFVEPLNRAQIEYMVSGGFAAIVYGHPRLTLDLDLVIRMAPRDSFRFAGLWPPAEFYCPPVEVIAAEAAREEHGHFNVIHNASALRADVYLAGTSQLHEWALGRRVTHSIGGQSVHVAPPEYVIVYKLLYARGGSDRHLRDIARMIEVRGMDLDQRALEMWIAQLALESLWQRARNLVGHE